MVKPKIILLNNVRLSFPNLFTKTAFDKQLVKEAEHNEAAAKKLKYEATFLLDKNEHVETIENINKECSALLKEFGVVNIKTQADLKYPVLKDGDNQQTADGIGYDGYDNKFFVKASNQFEFDKFDKSKNKVSADNDIFYAGCYVNALISLAVGKNTYGTHIYVNLLGIQFNADGEEFRANVSDVFSVIETPLTEQDIQTEECPF